MMKEQAKYMLATEFFGGDIDKYQALAVIEYGRELGFGPFYALQNVNIIQKKPACSSQMFLAMAQRMGGEIRYLNAQSDDTKAVVVYKRPNWPDWERLEFTIQQAHDLQLTKKDNWKKQPKTMLKWRAIAEAARTAFADALSGFYLAEELGASYEITPDGGMELQRPVAGGAKDSVVSPTTGEIHEFDDALAAADAVIEAEFTDAEFTAEEAGQPPPPPTAPATPAPAQQAGRVAPRLKAADAGTVQKMRQELTRKCMQLGKSKQPPKSDAQVMKDLAKGQFTFKGKSDLTLPEIDILLQLVDTQLEIRANNDMPVAEPAGDPSEQESFTEFESW
jgi:hypothetical protein